MAESVPCFVGFDTGFLGLSKDSSLACMENPYKGVQINLNDKKYQ